ncbi:DUF899 family protein [Sutcliffiella horikoshii]|uniref:DUF899 family protein n=1 Tax=Sutcliffiella horikoshii TaxID=79883 RepID=UPI003CED9B18
MNQTEMLTEIQQLEKEILEKKKQLAEMKRNIEKEKVDNYVFSSFQHGKVSLADLFEDKGELFVVHNMGKSCSYCTMWADGFSSVYHHIRRKAAFVVSTPDEPEVQENFAAERSWNFPVVSTKGTSFKEDMGFVVNEGFYPGVTVFSKDDKGVIYRHASSFFGPGDDFCSVWPFFDLLPSGYEDYKPSKKINGRSPYQLTNNIAVQVKEYEKAIEFYHRTLGFKPEKSTNSETQFTMNGLNFYIEKNNNQGHDNSVFFEFAVDNIEDAKGVLIANNCTITKEFSEKSMMVSDPFGLKFHLFQV